MFQRTGSSYNIPECQQIHLFEMLATITVEMPANIVFRKASNYNDPKCQQVHFAEVLAIMISKVIGIVINLGAEHNLNYHYDPSRRQKERLRLIN